MPKSENSMKPKPQEPTAIGSGLLALDIVLSEVTGAPTRFWAGGTCGNVLIALSFLGWKAAPVARLQSGIAADRILDDLRKWKVSRRFVSVSDDGSTPIIVERITGKEGSPPRHSFSWRCPDCGSHFPGFKPVLASVAENICSRIKTPQVFFFDRATSGALILARECTKAGALVVFEPSGIGNPILFRQAWRASHVVKYSHERLSELPDIAVDDDGDDPILQIETMGDLGLRYRLRRPGNRGTTWTELPALPAPSFKDSAGAGDWCTAGFLSQAATKGRKMFLAMSEVELAAALRYGQALAAWACGYEGARGGMYAVTRATVNQIVCGLLSGGPDIAGHIATGSEEPSNGLGTICFTCRDSNGRNRSKSS